MSCRAGLFCARDKPGTCDGCFGPWAAWKPGNVDRISALTAIDVTTVPVHAGEDIGPGLLRRIERDLEPCLGKGWLKRS